MTWTRWFSSIFIFNGIYYNFPFPRERKFSSSLVMAFNWLDFLLINNHRDNFFSGKPTKVEFHVTVMSLDSINEGSMVRLKIFQILFHFLKKTFSDVCRWHFLWSVLEWSSFEASREYDIRLSLTSSGMARKVVISFTTEYHLN